MFNNLKKRVIVPVAASVVVFAGSGFIAFREDFFEVAKQIEIFTNIFKAVNENYVDETNPGELMNQAIKSMLTDLDPYTVFFNEADVVRFKINASGEYTGIGAMVQRKDGRLIIKEPYKGYAADKAGLKAGDEIIQIGDVNLADFKEDAAQLLRGSKNTKIEITYKRQGKITKTNITLDEVELKAVPFFSKIDDKTGYIVLTAFNKRASLETKEALEQLKREGAERIVLDLRGNPGGLLGEAVNICNLFVPKGETIVTTKSKLEKHNNTYKTMREPIDTEIPLAILVDGKSASASEIVAGALQDLDRAVIVGSRSFGKGLVQRPIDLTYGTQLKITISRYYTPSGRCIQALDYAHRDQDGNAIRTKSTQYNAFKTRKGRTVYDGGGIQPDVELSESKTSPIADALLRNDGVFDFITEYYYNHPLSANQTPTITDADFTNFKSFLKRTNFSFDTETEIALKNTLAAAVRENVDGSIKNEYAQLLSALQKSEETQLDQHKAEIKSLLQDEAIRRYSYKEGLYGHYLKNNGEIKKAVALLANPSEYNKLLKI